jgi:hypothetical protein
MHLLSCRNRRWERSLFPVDLVVCLWPCAKRSPPGGTVFTRQPCYHVQHALE